MQENMDQPKTGTCPLFSAYHVRPGTFSRRVLHFVTRGSRIGPQCTHNDYTDTSCHRPSVSFGHPLETERTEHNGFRTGYTLLSRTNTPQAEFLGR
jgi:hypothetical protein